jgi:hypothetical protein
MSIIIKIMFDCFPPLSHGPSIYDDPSRFEESERCVDAYDDLKDFLHEYKISYYEQGVTRDKMDMEMDWLDNNAREIVP